MTLTLTACGAFFEKEIEVKSPCVAIDPTTTQLNNATEAQHPCTRRPANANWMS